MNIDLQYPIRNPMNYQTVLKADGTELANDSQYKF